MALGPTFDPTAAAAMSSELTRAQQTDANAARAHASEDLEAARGRSSKPRPRGRVRDLIGRLLGHTR